MLAMMWGMAESKPAIPSPGTSRVQYGPDEPAPPFDVPADYRYGAAQALDSLTGIAAPLLAGVALAIMGLILPAANKYVAGDWAVVLLVSAAAAFIMSVQCGFWARNYAVAPPEIAQWWPVLSAEDRWRRVRRAQWVAMARHRMWANRAQAAYGVGVLLLWAGVAIALVPHGTSSGTIVRWVAFGVSCLVGAAEVVWMLLVRARPQSQLRRSLDWLTRQRVGAVRGWLVGQDVPALPPERWPRRADVDPYADGHT